MSEILKVIPKASPSSTDVDDIDDESSVGGIESSGIGVDVGSGGEVAGGLTVGTRGDVAVGVGIDGAGVRVGSERSVGMMRGVAMTASGTIPVGNGVECEAAVGRGSVGTCGAVKAKVATGVGMLPTIDRGPAVADDDMNAVKVGNALSSEVVALGIGIEVGIGEVNVVAVA